MGIKNYYEYISNYYSDSIKDVWLSSYDCVFLDINQCLHRVIYTSNSELDLLIKLDHLIINILQNLNPRHKVIIASDGVAPMAKIVLQKKRRLLESCINSSSSSHNTISSLNFTPGTIFMKKLLLKLEPTLLKIKLLFNVEIECYMNTCDEAEIKIKNRMWIISKTNPEYTQCVISDDGDVILLSSNFENINNIYVMRKNIISMGVLLEQHKKKYGCGINVGLDFIALNIMLGNDYLPKVNYINYDKLWNAYKFSLDCGNKGLVIKYGWECVIDQTFMRDLLIGIITYMPKKYLHEFYVNLYNSKACDDYINGMLWCLNMYNEGICIYYDYMYNHKIIPHCYGLYLQLLQHPQNVSYKSLQSESQSQLQMQSEPIPLDLYSIIVLPKKSKHMIDKKYYNIMDSKEFEILYKDEYCDECKKINNSKKDLENKKKKLKNEQHISCINKELYRLNSILKLHMNRHVILTNKKIYELSEIFSSFNFF
jgi:hypothetical protein